MSNFTDKLKSFFEWLEHAHFFIRGVQFLVGLGLGQSVKATLMTSTTIPPIWITPIWLIATGVFIGLLVFVGNKISKRKGQSSGAQTAIANPEQFQDVEEFYRTYDNAVLVDTEGNIRRLSDQYRQGDDRERFLVRLLATAVTLSFFEITWLSIFGSQIKALEALNKGTLRTEQLRPYYDESAAKNTPYNYSFDSWFGFLRDQILLRPQGDTIEITARGREFLKFLIHYGRSSSDRAL